MRDLSTLYLGEAPNAGDPGEGLLREDGTLDYQALFWHLGIS